MTAKKVYKRDHSMESVVRPFNVSLDPFERKRRNSVGKQNAPVQEEATKSLVKSEKLL